MLGISQAARTKAWQCSSNRHRHSSPSRAPARTLRKEITRKKLLPLPLLIYPKIHGKIELLSENARMFIAEESPLIVRIGTVAITLVIACVFLAACFVRINGKTLLEWIEL